MQSRARAASNRLRRFAMPLFDPRRPGRTMSVNDLQTNHAPRTLYLKVPLLPNIYYTLAANFWYEVLV